MAALLATRLILFEIIMVLLAQWVSVMVVLWVVLIALAALILCMWSRLVVLFLRFYRLVSVTTLEVPLCMTVGPHRPSLPISRACRSLTFRFIGLSI